jgi:hypothetical protein
LLVISPECLEEGIDKLLIEYEKWSFTKKQYIDFNGVIAEE